MQHASIVETCKIIRTRKILKTYKKFFAGASGELLLIGEMEIFQKKGAWQEVKKK